MHATKTKHLPKEAYEFWFTRGMQDRINGNGLLKSWQDVAGLTDEQQAYNAGYEYIDSDVADDNNYAASLYRIGSDKIFQTEDK